MNTHEASSLTQAEIASEERIVLFIDDNYTIRKIVEHLLASDGYTVRTADDGKSGLEAFEKYPIDIVVTDIVMPELDGLKVLELIKRKSPQTPVIVLSGKGGLEDVKKALKLGAYDYLSKTEPGIDPDSLIAAVDRAWEKLQLTRENEAYKNELEAKVAYRTRELQGALHQLQRALELNRSEKRILNDFKLQAFRTIEHSERKYKALFEKAPNGIATISMGGYITAVNSAFVEILGFQSENQLKDKSISDIKTFLDSGFADKILDCLERKKEYSDEPPYRGPDDKDKFVKYTLTPIDLDEHGFEVEVLFTVKDITLEIEEKQRLEAAAMYDGLTGLLKQERFNDILTDTIQDANKIDFALAVVHIDLDEFKITNERFGHPAASEVLRLVGQRITKSVEQEKDFGFRVGGDEFAIIFTRYPPSALDVIVRRMFNKLSEVYSVSVAGEDNIIKCTFSIGVAEYSDTRKQAADQLYKEADDATFEAKRNGKNRYIFYRPDTEA